MGVVFILCDRTSKAAQGLHVGSGRHGEETLVAVAPLLHPALRAFRNDVGRGLFSVFVLVFVPKRKAVIIEAENHAAHAVFIALVGAVQALARQHLVLLAEASCCHLSWHRCPLVDDDVHHLPGCVEQLQVPVVHFHCQHAVGRRALPCLCRHCKQQACNHHTYIDYSLHRCYSFFVCKQ